MGATVLAYSGCSTCKKALKWLTARGVPHAVRAIVDAPPTLAELAAWVPASGLPLRKWLNTSGFSYRALGKARVDAATDDELAVLLSRDGKLVKRPVVVIEGRQGLARLSVLVGFREEAFKAQFGAV